MLLELLSQLKKVFAESSFRYRYKLFYLHKMTQLEEMSQLDTVVAVAEIVAEVAVAEIVVEVAVETAVEVVIVVVEDFLESQKMRVFDNKLEIFQGPGSCMAAIK